jgi:hypothetical protein
MKALNLNYMRLCILAGVLFALTGCGEKPEDTVKKYLDYTFLDNNGKKAYKLLSADDKKYKGEKEFISEVKRKNIFNHKILKKYKSQFNYEILETRQRGDTTFVKVSLTKPNSQNILHEMITFAMSTSFSKINEEEKNSIMHEQFGKILKSEEIETETEEKEFAVIEENGNYKIYLDLGYPYKQEVLDSLTSKLESEAEEHIRLIDFNAALNSYKKILALRSTNDTKQKILDLEIQEKNTVELGEKLLIGKLIFKPKKAEVRKINITRANWLDEEEKNIISEEEYFVLTFDITNNCEGEVFSFDEENKYKKEHTVYDNFGNIMSEFDLQYYMEHVENYIHKKLRPGETREVKAVCEAPLSKKSEKFLWKVKLFTDNKKTEDYAYVSFEKNEIKFTMY